MISIAEWTDRALALSSPMKLTSSASFSPSIRISLRLKIHQAQAKNFCRVLDIRVAQIVEFEVDAQVLFDDTGDELCTVGGQHFAVGFHIDEVRDFDKLLLFRLTPIGYKVSFITGTV